MTQTKQYLVLFSHGKESGPWGTKITALAALARRLGHDVASIDYTDLPDPDQRAERLVTHLAGRDGEGVVLVGSSMGGYVSTVASEKVRPRGMFLMAPAFGLPDYARQTPVPYAGATAIVHGWFDDVVPPEHSIRCATKHGAELHMLRDDHQLIGKLTFIEKLFEHFLGGL